MSSPSPVSTDINRIIQGDSIVPPVKTYDAYQVALDEPIEATVLDFGVPRFSPVKTRHITVVGWYRRGLKGFVQAFSPHYTSTEGTILYEPNPDLETQIQATSNNIRNFLNKEVPALNELIGQLVPIPLPLEEHRRLLERYEKKGETVSNWGKYFFNPHNKEQGHSWNNDLRYGWDKDKVVAFLKKSLARRLGTLETPEAAQGQEAES